MTTAKAKIDPADKAPGKPPARIKKLLMFGVAAIALIGAGIGGGVYAAGYVLGDAEHKNENLPKLVERSEDHGAHADGGHGEDKEPVPKIGTVAVKNDRAKIDPHKFEPTYFPIEQSFTANLMGGSGFVQVGLSLATYYDGKVIANIKRHIVPIRSAILLTLSEQDAMQIATPPGKQRLRVLLSDSINKVLREKEGFGGIDSVYFTNLVVQ